MGFLSTCKPKRPTHPLRHLLVSNWVGFQRGAGFVPLPSSVVPSSLVINRFIFPLCPPGNAVHHNANHCFFFTLSAISYAPNVFCYPSFLYRFFLVFLQPSVHKILLLPIFPSSKNTMDLFWQKKKKKVFFWKKKKKKKKKK